MVALQCNISSFKSVIQEIVLMKRLNPVVIIYILTFAACTRSDTALPVDNGCIERITLSVTAHSINSSDVQTVNNLFSSNGIDYSRFRYFQYIRDTFQTLYPPYTKHDEQLVRVDQYTNGVRIFNDVLVYLFWDNNLHNRTGDLTIGTSLDNSPHLTLGQIRKLFLDNIEHFDHTSNQFKDSCFKTEFGYYNINAGTSNSREVLVKAWHVTPKFSSFPEAYFQDTDGQLIYYFNGVETFK